MVFRIIGAFLILWAFADFTGNLTGFDVWRDIAGIRPQGLFRQYSAWGVLLPGSMCWILGTRPDGGRC